MPYRPIGLIAVYTRYSVLSDIGLGPRARLRPMNVSTHISDIGLGSKSRIRPMNKADQEIVRTYKQIRTLCTYCFTLVLLLP